MVEINGNIMTPKDIRKIIREIITEIGLYTLKNQTDQLKGLPNLIDPDDSTEKSPAFMSKYKRVSEMARKPKGFEIINPDFDTTEYIDKKISGISIGAIIDYIKENPGIEKSQIQTHFNFIRPQIANAIVNGLLDAGIIAKAGSITTDDETGEITVDNEPETPSYRADAEDFFVGKRGGNFFNGEQTELEPESETAEEIPDEFDIPENPEIPELPTEDNIDTQSRMSDEDYKAWMEYGKYKERLAKIKMALLQTKKSRRGGDDLSLDINSELGRLIDKKAEYETHIQDIVNSNSYVKNKISKYNPSETEIMERFQKLANITL
jgi:hypothetical protein